MSVATEWIPTQAEVHQFPNRRYYEPEHIPEGAPDPDILPGEPSSEQSVFEDDSPQQSGNLFLPHMELKGGYLPLAIIRADLKQGAKVLYSLLCRYSGKDGRCFPSYKTLSQDMGTTERNIKMYVSELKEKGFLLRHHDSSGRWSFSFRKHESFKESDLRVNKCSPPHEKTFTPGVNECSPKEKSRKKDIKNIAAYASTTNKQPKGSREQEAGIDLSGYPVEVRRICQPFIERWPGIAERHGYRPEIDETALSKILKVFDTARESPPYCG